MKTFSVLFSVLLLLCFVSAKDRCEPGFANVCFSAVHSELNKVIHSNGKDINFNDNKYLENLCYTIDDALNCTSDIIDVDCSVEEGRAKFDKWRMAFDQTYFELCDANATDDKIMLRAIVMNLNCWDANHFFECLETHTGITNVSDLIAIGINKKECDLLYQTFEFCRLEQLNVTKEFCTQNQTSDAIAIVHHLFDTFMASSHCINYYRNSYNKNQFNLIQSFVLLILLYFSTFAITS